jgi:ubiquinone/menaquinone biosynthesis C-methylase UbiE
MDSNDSQQRGIREIAQALSIDAWLECVTNSLESATPTSVDGVTMPTAPSAELQTKFVGGAGKHAIYEAAMFYRYVLDTCAANGIPTIGRMLDFGCGWGRYTRLFLRDVEDGGLIGVDPEPAAIDVCRTHVPQASFLKSDYYPPLPFRDQFFDVVIAYSVFSHLYELPAHAWINELSRVLRPGGLLIATTHPIWILEFVEKLRLGEIPMTSDWHVGLSKSWMDLDETRRRYESGEFLPAREIGEYYEGYGDVIVSPGYVSRVWGKIMEPVEFVSDRDRIAQAAFVLRKRRS